jgi:Flp pilus assembly protein TadD
MFRGLSALLLLGMVASGVRADSLAMNYERLMPSIELLSTADRDIVSDTISLIKDGEHTLALSRLSSLKQRNPQNSSLRILASYVLLQIGNQAGAFEEAEKAHDDPDGDDFKCWFLAKVALLSGKRAVCEREIAHLRQHSEMAAEVNKLEEELRDK